MIGHDLARDRFAYVTDLRVKGSHVMNHAACDDVAVSWADQSPGAARGATESSQRCAGVLRTQLSAASSQRGNGTLRCMGDSQKR